MVFISTSENPLNMVYICLIMPVGGLDHFLGGGKDCSPSVPGTRFSEEQQI